MPVTGSLKERVRGVGGEGRAQAAALDIGTLIKQHRTLARLTQVQLADLSTVSLRTIRNLEAGRAIHPRPETVRLLADGLRLSPRDLEALGRALGRGPRGAALVAAVGRVTNPARPPIGRLAGRHRELESALAVIRSGSSRAITISGFGGVGKSRLAAAIAESAANKYSIPWLWVPLAAALGCASRPVPVGDWNEGTPTERFSTWAQGFAEGAEAAIDELASLIGSRPFLLVLDDVARSSAALEAATADLLQRCSGLVVVETTRHPVGRAKRRLMPLRPLDLGMPPNGGTAQAGAEDTAVGLLIALARTTCPPLPGDRAGEGDGESLAEICRALDGLPRAIENAASWLAVCQPGQVADMARADPFAVGRDPDSEADGERWAYEALADALDGLPFSQYGRLERLAAAPHPWTVAEAAAMTREGSVSAAQSIFELLVTGLIRPVSVHTAEPRTFTVLNHVRSLLA